MDDRALKLPMVFKCFFFSKITELKIEVDTFYAKKEREKEVIQFSKLIINNCN